MTNQILFYDNEHTWRILQVKFSMTSTIPINEIRAEYSNPTKDDWGAIGISAILTKTNEFEYGKIPMQNENFYEILECMQIMNTLCDLLHLYIMGTSHISKSRIDLKDEVKAIETLRTWIEYANELHRLAGIKEKVVLTDNLIMKVARETRPTIFSMEDPKARVYDDSKSVITFLSPYEDNTKALNEKKKSKNCIIGENKIKEFLSEDSKPFLVGGY